MEHLARVTRGIYATGFIYFLNKATPSRLGDITDLPNTQKQTVGQNDDTKQSVPMEENKTEHQKKN